MVAQLLTIHMEELAQSITTPSRIYQWRCKPLYPIQWPNSQPDKHLCHALRIRSSKFYLRTLALQVLTQSTWKLLRTPNPSTLIVSSSISLCRWNPWHRGLPMRPVFKAPPLNSRQLTTPICTITSNSNNSNSYSRCNKHRLDPLCIRKDQHLMVSNKLPLCKIIKLICLKQQWTWCKHSRCDKITTPEHNQWQMKVTRQLVSTMTMAARIRKWLVLPLVAHLLELEPPLKESSCLRLKMQLIVFSHNEWWTIRINAHYCCRLKSLIS